MLIVFGNIIPKSVTETFFGNMLKKLSADTKFRTGYHVSPTELNQFCCRFHGKASASYENSLIFDVDWPNIQPFLHDGAVQVPKSYMSFAGPSLTHQFYALNKSVMDRMFQAADNHHDLAREACKYINAMR